MICPLCKRELDITVEDDEGNVHYDDYEDNPYSGLWFGIKHPDYCNECVLTDTRYNTAFPTREAAEKEMQRFGVLVMSFRPGNEKVFDELMQKVTSMVDDSGW